MSRVISLIVLLAVLAAVAVVFYQVMAGFFVPLFLAVILVVMFQPVHQWSMAKCGGRGHLAAGLTTAIVLLAVLVPLSIVMLQAGREGVRVAKQMQLLNAEEGDGPEAPEPPASDASQENDATSTLTIKGFIARTVNELGLPITEDEQAVIADEAVEQLRAFAQPLILGGARVAGSTLLGLLVMIVALYFFLLDGPKMIAAFMELIPLEAAHKQELLDRFVNVSRAIVTATLLSAVVQGILAGGAYAVAGLQSVFLLMSLTMLLAMVPFVGAVSVWLPCCLWLYFHDRTAAAVGLAIFGAAVVSQADNLIKPLVLHGQSNLHPLLALLSVLGGVQALGPIGIVVGPMAVAFLQTLLNMLRLELIRFDDDAPRDPPANPQPLRPFLRRVRMISGRVAARPWRNTAK